MARTRAVSGGGRAVEVEPERLDRWFARFAERNDGVRETVLRPERVVVTGGDGTTATARVPFPPLPGAAGEVRPGLAVAPLVEHAGVPRRLGLLLVRLGGHSVGVAEGGRVLVSRTDRHLVHGRSAAGGWSQQRFARRREGQARQALRAAADDALDVLGPHLGELDGVVLGGDRKALDELRRDPRLERVFALAVTTLPDLGEPRRTVLDEAAGRARSVEIVVRDPA
ncbi:hypothetical protein B0I33_108160 [Prauserella shujinwangii]|uniref:Actinobacteria/chloroflexi VLRF1 release factor domain-containing protein n=1 Tax=Prauserella shujinwangii TaxID=1453103 RepID=A0A2T0LRD3_9PSEU|nr:acVLRF1 family peptidyl-tRNA hydrolase [Prauserella shujinwangii]PRX46013.1 hypothetical protein B0I33_108160 [Prauserella shujinwangii]